jgi:two-component system sensor histidine kinase BaeS
LPRTALFDADGELIVGNPLAPLSPNRLAIKVDDKVVGELRIEPLRELTQAIDVQFVRRQSSALIYIAIGLLLFSGLAALLVARLFTRPLKSLLAGSQRIGSGVYDQPIVVGTTDELGELASSFNSVGETLNKNRDARQRWLADISHELRTPLAILTGELQAIEDGVRQMDTATRQSLQAEVLRLNQLVGDLHELSLSDEGGPGYRRDAVDLAVVLTDVLSATRGRLSDGSITLRESLPPDGTVVTGDSVRLTQLFINLVENSLRYTDAPGELSVSYQRQADSIDVIFEDSPPGVPAKSLPYIFERLYRVDESRSRQTGGSGLGLAICQGIVQAHNGEIFAKPSQLGGLAVHVRLPLAADTGE